MYRCKLCGNSSETRETRLMLVEYREVLDLLTKDTRQEVKRETPVCAACYAKSED